MPLHVLLADDSVPAQNMGKKILVEAGYDVLTVSNGLEALRKIAEHAPDIAILDIFMPGYTGLEICERLRASTATAALPVILTVGKLEPYRPEDGEHVHSNAVIVKPFAAAELTSAVRSLIGTAQSHPPVDSVGEAGPLKEADAAADEAIPGPLAADQPAEGSQEQEADEPLFSLGASEAPSSNVPWSPRGQSVYVDAPLAAGIDSTGLESLAFNPDAASTPFSASALDDLLPSTSSYPAEHGSSPFTEFDLELEPSPYSVEPDPFESAAEESLAPSEPEVVAPESAITADEIFFDSDAQAQSISAILDIPSLDPLLDMQEADLPSDLSEASTGDVEAQEVFEPEVAGVQDNSAPDLSEDQLSSEEEARRLAFEELFNSPDPIPLDDFSAPPAKIAEDPLLDNPESDHSAIFVQDSDAEPLSLDGQPELAVPEIDSHPVNEVKLEEAEPTSVIGAIPDRDPLLEETNFPEAECALEPEKAFISIPSELESLQFSEIAEPTPESLLVNSPAAEAQQTVAEAHPEAPEVFELEQPAEIAPAIEIEQVSEPGVKFEIEPTSETTDAAQAIPEQPEVRIVSETASAETQAEPEPAYSAPELQVAEPEPEVIEIAYVAEAVHAVEAVPEQPEIQQIVPEAAPPEPQAESEPAYVASELQVAEPEPEVLDIEHVAGAVHAAEAVPEQPEVQEIVSETAPAATQAEPEPECVASESQVAEPEPAHLEAQAAVGVMSVFSELKTPEQICPEPEAHATEISSSPESSIELTEAERVSQAVDRVFNRFKRLLVKAIVRELERPV